jgi:hypothetical protein
MRQNKNIQYAYVLENLRTNKVYNSNYELFKTQFFSNLKINILEDPWRIVTFIVLQNELHDSIHHHMIKINSQALKQKCYTILTINIYKKTFDT